MTDSPPYAVGIDLGTTHCALAFADGDGAAVPQPLAIPQIVAAGEIGERRLLPSFLFFPSPDQFAAGALALPWYPAAGDVVGDFARQQGASTPMRLVSSAKSWLSHAGVDRQGEILPWDAPKGVPRVSPVQASARYLGHLRAVWERAHPDAPLAEQDVVLTVPASFDAVARDLTMEAAELAGFFEPPTLLEEPQAAMYDWLAQRGDAWRSELAVGDVVLVVDIGGGTTDFSLISVGESEGALQLARVAVGDHILLGGDNMDLALAYGVRAQLEAAGTEIDDWQMRALTYACRGAKETLLSDAPPPAVSLSIAARGRKLVGGTVRAELSRATLDALVLDGFLPVVDADARPQTPTRAGLTTLGLPYPADAAITRHLAAFLARAGEGQNARPTAILFNGGVTRSSLVRDRITGILAQWLAAAGAPAPKVLSGADAELAVSRGAAHYAQVRRGGGVRIRGGTARTYYIGIERAELAVPGIPPRLDAVCIAPLGMEEGSEVQLPQPLGLVLGEPVSFRFFGSATRRDDGVGQVARPADLTELSPIETTLPAADDGEPGQIVSVRVGARVTEVGTLELAAVEVAGGRRHRLTFDVRGGGG
jgi:molecular chaperone DnaK (HSP70)